MLFPENQQFFVVVLSGAGWVDPYPDMLKTLIISQKRFDLPGVDKAGKVIVHVKRYPADLRVPFQKRNQSDGGSAA